MVTANSRAATWYRQAQRAIDRRRATTALRLAVEADPAFELALADLDAMTGTSGQRHSRGQMNWERHHIEVVRTAASGNGKRAADLLREHLAGVGCDPLAFRIVAQDATAGRDGRRLRRPRSPAPRLPPSPMAGLSITAPADAIGVIGFALSGRLNDRQPDASRSALCDTHRFPGPRRVELEEVIVDPRDPGPHKVVVQARRSVIRYGA